MLTSQNQNKVFLNYYRKGDDMQPQELLDFKNVYRQLTGLKCGNAIDSALPIIPCVKLVIHSHYIHNNRRLNL